MVLPLEDNAKKALPNSDFDEPVRGSAENAKLSIGNGILADYETHRFPLR